MLAGLYHVVTGRLIGRNSLDPNEKNRRHDQVVLGWVVVGMSMIVASIGLFVFTPPERNVDTPMAVAFSEDGKTSFMGKPYSIRLVGDEAYEWKVTGAYKTGEMFGVTIVNAKKGSTVSYPLNGLKPGNVIIDVGLLGMTWPAELK
jgi:hypothetical protein